MFILNSKETIQKAIERAKAIHPTVRIKRFGEYLVTGSAGNFYTVRCEKRGSSRLWIATAWRARSARLASMPPVLSRSTSGLRRTGRTKMKGLTEA